MLCCAVLFLGVVGNGLFVGGLYVWEIERGDKERRRGGGRRKGDRETGVDTKIARSN